MKKIAEALRAFTHRSGLERRVIRYQRARIAELEHQLREHEKIQDRYGLHRHASPRRFLNYGEARDTVDRFVDQLVVTENTRMNLRAYLLDSLARQPRGY